MNIINEKCIPMIENFCKDMLPDSYCMLLCKDISYYTIFHFVSEWRRSDVDTIAIEVLNCLSDIGTIIAFDDEEEDHLEFWVKNEDGIFCVLFFNYTNGVIDVF